MISLRQLFNPSRAALTAAATVVSQVPTGGDATGRFGSANLNPRSLSWQQEVWGFYRRLGMFRNAVTWKADMLSRVRLRAAQQEVGKDEPTILDVGPAAELIGQLNAAVQSALMRSFATYLTVPGEGYLVGETQPNGTQTWRARSMGEVRWRPSASARNGTASDWETIDDERSASGGIYWRPLAADSLVMRVWNPDAEFHYLADSPGQSALDMMRELELVNRKIQAEYVSRLSTNGLVLFPQEMTFPIREEFVGQPNAVMLEWLEIAAEAIRTPGSAAAAVPIPMTVPGEYLGKIQHLPFEQPVRGVDQSVQRRENAVKQLAIDLDVPPEALLGMADANHWTGWLISEEGFKTYLAPTAEQICAALTTGYLQSQLKAIGIDDPTLVVWYDPSEITQRPDKSENAKDAYDRGELSGDALRRETGFDDDDKPSDEELARQVLFQLTKQPGLASAALRELTGVDLAPPTPAPAPGRPAPPDGTAPQDGPPPPPPADTPPAGPAPGDQMQQAADAAAATARRQIWQAGLAHAVRFSLDGIRLLHPADCTEHLMSCPVTYATWEGFPIAPGTHGVYECILDDQGRPRLGHQLRDADVRGMHPTAPKQPVR